MRFATKQPAVALCQIRTRFSAFYLKIDGIELIKKFRTDSLTYVKILC